MLLTWNARLPHMQMRKEESRLLQLPCSHSSCRVPFIKETRRYRIYTALKEKSIYFNVVSSDTEKQKYLPNNGI